MSNHTEEARIINLADLRDERGMLQTDVAERLNVDRSAVSKWESGATRPCRKYRPMLADAYGVSVETINAAIAETAGA